jgi:hypothetical protein
MKADFQRQFPPQYQGRPNYQQSNTINQGAINTACFNNMDGQQRGIMLGNALAFALPLKFDEFICQELMVTLDQAQDFIHEYRRYIVMQGLSSVPLYPSEPVEKVWLIHMAHTTNYVRFCTKVCRRVFYHIPYTGETSGEQDRNAYELSLEFYRAVYLQEPPSMVWPPSSVRFQMANFQHSYINLVRISGLYSRYLQDNLQFQNTRRRNPSRAIDEEKAQRIKSRKGMSKRRKAAGAMAAVAAGGAAIAGAGLILGAGALAFVANPYDIDYNSEELLDIIEDGFYEGLDFAQGIEVPEIDFGELFDEMGGQLGEWAEGIELPEIDFAEFQDVMGDLFGEIGEFAEGVGEGAFEAIGDLIGEIDW